MFGTQHLAAFMLASVLLWLTPGSDTMYIVAQSMAQGRQAGWLSVLGINSGILVHTIFAAFGLSAILATSTWAFATIKVAGAIYLIYLGMQALLKKSAALTVPDIGTTRRWKVYRQGVITNVLNPKIAIFFLAFLPQFVAPATSLGAVPFLFLGILFVAGSTIWCFIIAMFAAAAASTLRQNVGIARWLERCAGCVYVVLGLNLLRSKSAAA